MFEPLVLFIFAALIFSAFIKGSLGMGFSTICMAILANVIELKTAISLVLLPSLTSNLMVMFAAGNFRLCLRTFASLLIMAVPGMLIGFQLLKQSDNTISVVLLALVLMFYGVWGLKNHALRLDSRWVPRLNPIVGLLTGTVNGATGSQIFPIMPYLLSLQVSKDVLVQTMNMSFTLCSIVMLLGLVQMGTLDTQSMLTYSLGIIPVMFGVWLGDKVRQRLSDERFRKSVMLLIITLGGLLLLRAVS